MLEMPLDEHPHLRFLPRMRSEPIEWAYIPRAREQRITIQSMDGKEIAIGRGVILTPLSGRFWSEEPPRVTEPELGAYIQIGKAAPVALARFAWVGGDALYYDFEV
jgi:hypothetical protein